jgi:hypothetical protein
MKVNPKLLDELRAKNIKLNLDQYTKRVNEEGIFLEK